MTKYREPIRGPPKAKAKAKAKAYPEDRGGLVRNR